jgi:ABC-type multidrug transport system fused ATPase/permease subunit
MTRSLENGGWLSGGQKQRISIARAICMNPAILILDDSTSAVDMETEFQIQKALREFMKGRTTFIIAHRISSLKHADEILVLDQGSIIERGTHEQLLANDGAYRSIYNIQYQDQAAIMQKAGG